MLQQCYLESDHTTMFYAAKALMTLQALYGVIPNLYGKGECAAVCMSVLRFKTELSFASALFISHVLVLQKFKRLPYFKNFIVHVRQLVSCSATIINDI